MGTTKWDIYLNKEKYFVVTFLAKLCIILHSRFDDELDHSVGIQLMQLFSENKFDFTKMTDILGLYCQIHNDYRNLFRMEVTSELLVVDI
jgi:hypothetical protein